jgi:hypothetical protein
MIMAGGAAAGLVPSAIALSRAAASASSAAAGAAFLAASARLRTAAAAAAVLITAARTAFGKSFLHGTFSSRHCCVATAHFLRPKDLMIIVIESSGVVLDGSQFALVHISQNLAVSLIIHRLWAI